jgi:hypothetical protein
MLRPSNMRGTLFEEQRIIMMETRQPEIQNEFKIKDNFFVMVLILIPGIRYGITKIEELGEWWLLGMSFGLFAGSLCTLLIIGLCIVFLIYEWSRMSFIQKFRHLIYIPVQVTFFFYFFFMWWWLFWGASHFPPPNGSSGIFYPEKCFLEWLGF